MKGLWRSIRFVAVVLWATACGPPPSDVAVAPLPQRIVTWAPNLTEAIDVLGLSSRLVGTDDFSRHTPEIAALPKLGGLFNPNLELLAAIRPDLVIALPSSKDVATRAEALGIEVLVVRSEDLDDVEAGLRTIAERCGVAERGLEIAARLRHELEPRSVAAGTRVFLVVRTFPRAPVRAGRGGPGHLSVDPDRTARRGQRVLRCLGAVAPGRRRGGRGAPAGCDLRTFVRVAFGKRPVRGGCGLERPRRRPGGGQPTRRRDRRRLHVGSRSSPWPALSGIRTCSGSARTPAMTSGEPSAPPRSMATRKTAFSRLVLSPGRLRGAGSWAR